MEYSHKKLIVWQRGMELADHIYTLTDSFPVRETYTLVDQMRRAAISIPSNIAEGRTRGSDRDFIHFLLISRGSCSELDTQLLLSEKRGYISQQQAVVACRLCEEVSNRLTNLIRSIKKSGPKVFQ